MAIYAEACGMPYVNERWLGGMLTNFQTVSTRVKRMKEFEAMQKAGDFDAMPKKEALRHTRELEKLQRNLGGIRGLDRLPDAIFVIDTKKEHIAVTEANKLGHAGGGRGRHQLRPRRDHPRDPGQRRRHPLGALLCRVVADAVVEGRFIAQQRPAPPAAAAPAASAPHPAARRPRPPWRRRRRGRSRRRGRAGAGRRRPPAGADDAGRPGRPTEAAPVAAAAAPAADRAAGTDRHRLRHPSAAPAAAGTPTPPTAAEAPAPAAEAPAPTDRGGLSRARLLRQGRPEAAPAHRRGHARRQARARGERRRHGQGRSLAAREGPGQPGQAGRPRGLRGAVAIGRVGRRRLHRAAAVGDRLRGQVGRVRGPGRPSWPSWWPPRARTAIDERADDIDDLKITLKENISVGQVVRIEAPAGGVVDSYLHLQAGRGVNAVVVALDGGTDGAGPRRRRPHRLRPARPTSPGTRCPRTRWPPSARRWRRSPATRASPTPRCPRSSRAGSNGWYKERVLLDQPYVKDEKQTIAKLLGSATVTRFAQVVVGD